MTAARPDKPALVARLAVLWPTGMARGAIAAELGVSISCVEHWRADLGLAPRRQGHRARPAGSVELDEQIKALLASLPPRVVVETRAMPVVPVVPAREGGEGHGRCFWTSGDRRSGWMFCEEPRVGKGPFCLVHRQRGVARAG